MRYAIFTTLPVVLIFAVAAVRANLAYREQMQRRRDLPPSVRKSLEQADAAEAQIFTP